MRNTSANSHAVTAARAMYVLEVTRSNPGWSCWSEHETLYVRCGILLYMRAAARQQGLQCARPLLLVACGTKHES